MERTTRPSTYVGRPFSGLRNVPEQCSHRIFGSNPISTAVVNGPPICDVLLPKALEILGKRTEPPARPTILPRQGMRAGVLCESHVSNMFTIENKNIF